MKVARAEEELAETKRKLLEESCDKLATQNSLRLARRQRDNAREELATTKDAMSRMEGEIQRACGLLRDVLSGNAYAIMNTDMLHITTRVKWHDDATKFIEHNDAGPYADCAESAAP